MLISVITANARVEEPWWWAWEWPCMGWHAATGLERTLFQGGDWGFGIGDSKEQEHQFLLVLYQCWHVTDHSNPHSRIPHPRLHHNTVPLPQPRDTPAITPA